MSSKDIHVIECDGPPDRIPTDTGMHWVDLLNRKTYESVGTAAISDWIVSSGDSDITKLMGCAVSVAVDDLVFQSTTTNNLAVTATDNLNISPVIGHVVSKPTTATCMVQLKGVLPFTIGRGKVYLSATGTYSNTAPATGFLQTLGWSCGDGRLEINPSLMRIKRN